MFSLVSGHASCQPSKCFSGRHGNRLAAILPALDVIALVGLLAVAGLVMRGTLPLSKGVAYGCFAGAGVVSLLFVACLLCSKRLKTTAASNVKPPNVAVPAPTTQPTPPPAPAAALSEASLRRFSIVVEEAEGTPGLMQGLRKPLDLRETDQPTIQTEGLNCVSCKLDKAGQELCWTCRVISTQPSLVLGLSAREQLQADQWYFPTERKVPTMIDITARLSIEVTQPDGTIVSTTMFIMTNFYWGVPGHESPKKAEEIMHPGYCNIVQLAQNALLMKMKKAFGISS